MFRIFSAISADDLWRDVTSCLVEGGEAFRQPSRNGMTREMLHVGLSLGDPRQRWVISREPALNPAFALAEVVWIISGRNDAPFLNFFNRALPKFAGTGRRYYGAYGYRLRTSLGFDQIERAYSVLRARPESRQVVLQIWNNKLDLPSPEGKERDPDIPCNIASMLKVRARALEWTQVIRSNDVFRGLPYNLVQFTSLQEVMAGWLSMEVGSHNVLSDSMHVYEDCIDDLKKSRKISAPQASDSLALPKKESDKVFKELASRVERIIAGDVAGQALIAGLRRTQLPSAYRNILCVLEAEGIRRRREEHLVDEVMGECRNPLYVALYDRWIERLKLRRELIEKKSS